MLRTNEPTIAPAPLHAGEMAQVLAALVAHEAEVASLVARLAPRTAEPILSELARLGTGGAAPDEPSAAVRWILPEILEEVGRRHPAQRD
jgi:hypothetical protein